MNLLGIFRLFTGAIDLLGGVGCKTRKERFPERLWFAVLYLMLLAGGIFILVISIRELYFS